MIEKSIKKILLILFLYFIYKRINRIFIKKVVVAYGLNNNYIFQTYISITTINKFRWKKLFDNNLNNYLIYSMIL